MSLKLNMLMLILVIGSVAYAQEFRFKEHPRITGADGPFLYSFTVLEVENATELNTAMLRMLTLFVPTPKGYEEANIFQKMPPQDYIDIVTYFIRKHNIQLCRLGVVVFSVGDQQGTTAFMLGCVEYTLMKEGIRVFNKMR